MVIMPYRMPNGKWRAKRMIHGKIKTRVCATKAEARAWEGIQNAETWSVQDSETPTACLLDLANAYVDMAQERFAQKTVSEKKLAFKYLLKAAPPTIPPEDLTPEIAMRALRLVARSSSGNAANKARKNLVAAWEWWKKYYGLPPANPFKEVERFPAEEKKRYVPTEEDFWKAYDAATTAEDRAMLLLMLHTAGRRGEVFRLRWEDVDFSGRKVRLGTRKNAHGGMEYAWVPMTESLYNDLAVQKMRCQSEYVFTDPQTGEPYTARQHFMKRLCRRARVHPFGFHAIRHLSATIQAGAGMAIPEVQTMLRHKNPNTTARYIRSLGVTPHRLDQVFTTKKRASKLLPFEAQKEAIGT